MLAPALAGIFVLLPGCAYIERSPVAGAVGTQTAAIAFFPIENLTGRPAPAREIRQSLKDALVIRGFRILEEDDLERFMVRNRVRYTGGIDGATAAALKSETGAGAVLLSSVELYDDAFPPKIALRSRLVSLGELPEILWMGSVGLAGDDSPGLLDLGIVEDPSVLLRRAIGLLADSLTAGIREGTERPVSTKGFGPKMHYGSVFQSGGRKMRVLVMPFLNRSSRKFAGNIMTLHVIEQLLKRKEFSVLEPGVVRKQLLQLRVIMKDGPSLPDITGITTYLEADLVVSGNVLDYRDYGGAGGGARVEFTVQAVEPVKRQVVWSSLSYNESNDKVYLFDWGRVNTAHVLASKMAGAVTDAMLKQ